MAKKEQNRIMVTEKSKAKPVQCFSKFINRTIGISNKCFVGMLRFAAHPTSWRYNFKGLKA